MRKSKNRYFYHIFVSSGDAPGTITLNGWKENSMLTNCLAACTHLSSTVSQLFEPQVQKNRRFLVPQPTFLFPLETPLRLSTQYAAWMERQFNACQTPCSEYLSIFNSFRVMRCLSLFTFKSKNRYFYHIFVSPVDAPGAITLNVVWMVRKFDAYKLSRCMYPSKYNRFWDTARMRDICEKIGILSYPLAFDAPVRGVPVGISAPPLVWEN